MKLGLQFPHTVPLVQSAQPLEQVKQDFEVSSAYVPVEQT